MQFKNKLYYNSVSTKSKESNKKLKMLKFSSKNYLLLIQLENNKKSENYNLKYIGYTVENDSNTKKNIYQYENVHSKTKSGSCSDGKNTPSPAHSKSPSIGNTINITTEYSNLQNQMLKNVNRKNDLKNTLRDNDDETIEKKFF